MTRYKSLTEESAHESSRNHHLAQGAFVGTCPADAESPEGAAPGCALAQGARVGAIGPGGSREVSGNVDGTPLGFVDGAGTFALAHGALVPGPAECVADGTFSSGRRDCAAV
jgi:hypothetical protein